MENFNTAQFKALARIIKHPAFEFLMDEAGLFEQSIEAAIGYNSAHDNVYIAFDNETCLYTRTNSDTVQLLFSNYIDGEEYSTASELEEALKVEEYTEIHDCIKNLLPVFKKAEELLRGQA